MKTHTTNYYWLGLLPPHGAIPDVGHGEGTQDKLNRINKTNRGILLPVTTSTRKHNV